MDDNLFCYFVWACQYIRSRLKKWDENGRQWKSEYIVVVIKCRIIRYRFIFLIPNMCEKIALVRQSLYVLAFFFKEPLALTHREI